MSDLLRVDDVGVHCVIGVYPEERTTPQALRVSLVLRLHAELAARSGKLSDTVDYARLLGQLRFVLQRGCFCLIETAAEALCAVVLHAAPSVVDVTLTLQKPSALGGNGVPALSLTRRRVTAGGGAARLWSGPDAAVEQVLQPAGAVLALPVGCGVLDIDAGRQGVVVDHDGVVGAFDDTRALLVVGAPPFALDAIVVRAP